MKLVRYGIRIDGKYFKDYVYHDGKKLDGYAGHTAIGSRYLEEDIIDIITTNKPEREEINRSIGSTISTLVKIEKLKDKVIEIVPL